MGFETIAPTKDLLACTTVLALAINPGVFGALKPDVAVVALEGLGNGVLARCVLRAIHAPASKQAGEVSNADAKHLLGQDVIDALFKVRDLVGQALGEAAGNLT
jgi:hypothetical protein